LVKIAGAMSHYGTSQAHPQGISESVVSRPADPGLVQKDAIHKGRDVQQPLKTRRGLVIETRLFVCFMRAQ